MIEINALLFIVVCEALGMALIVLLVVFTVVSRRKRREREAVRALAEAVKAGSAERRSELARVLASLGCADEAACQQSLEQILAAETAFYSHLVRAWLDRAPALITGLSERLQSVTAPYVALMTVHGAAAADAQPSEIDGQQDIQGDIVMAAESDLADERQARIEALEAENQVLGEQVESLKTEVRITNETMEKILSEYSRAFTKPQAGAAKDTPAAA